MWNVWRKMHENVFCLKTKEPEEMDKQQTGRNNGKRREENGNVFKRRGLKRSPRGSSCRLTIRINNQT